MAGPRFSAARVGKVGEIPTYPHWAVIRYQTVSVTGGYENDACSYLTTAYYVFKTEKEWLEAVVALQHEKLNSRGYGSEHEFVAFHVDKFAIPQVTVTVTTEMK